jgi:23S rRNA (cytidine1920-2'-O)/16S rRNA (cytidine1409-2'-O)-methyltransferase
MRLDQYLVEKGMYPTRNRAQEAIKQGQISINDKIIVKVSQDVDDSDIVRQDDAVAYVARSANKLFDALAQHPHDFIGKNVLDIGASTGGFTQVALLNGARSVVAVDVGTRQLDVSLRNDPRVVSLENTDARNLTLNSFDAPIDILLMDVSFISGRKILATVLPLLKPPLFAYVLVKPQYEVGLPNITKEGFAKNQRVVDAMLEEYKNFLRSYACTIHALFPCGFKGKEGNTEYFVVFEKT